MNSSKQSDPKNYTKIITTDPKKIKLFNHLIYLLVSSLTNQALRIFLIPLSFLGSINFNVYTVAIFGLINGEISYRVASVVYRSRFGNTSSNEDMNFIRQFYIFQLNLFFSFFLNIFFFLIYFFVNNLLIRTP